MFSDRKMYESEVNYSGRLEAEIKRLRAALQEALECLTAPGDGTVGDALRVIRGAIGHSSHQ